jgi:hypothetical protein
MSVDEFRESVKQAAPPTGLSLALQALWYDAKGDWDAAHRAAQAQDDRAGAWVHAYLHRVEGDPGNAAYWYRRAGRPVSTQALPDEWATIVAELLAA